MLSAVALTGLPEIEPGDDLAEVVLAATGEVELRPGDVLAVAHKIVSKAEGRVRVLSDVEVSARAQELALRLLKDPRHVQVVLDESAAVLRAERGVLICQTHHGFVCANAGVDASNAADGTLVVLPEDPDRSARTLRTGLHRRLGWAPAVLISDSFGRAWRNGQVDVCIGCAGLAALDDWRGRTDSRGRILRATWLAVADAIAAMADLARGKDAGEPVVVLRGLERFVTAADGPGARPLVRAPAEDLFR